MEKQQKNEEGETVVGIPYNPNMNAYQYEQQQQQNYYVIPNPYQSGVIPPHAIFDDPKGVPVTQTIFRDTPAPFTCPFCSHTSLSRLKSKPSAAAVVACMMPMMLGFCFLCPSMDCLWHKYHYCPACARQVADFEKSDVCAVMDPPNWELKSFGFTA